MSAQALTEQSEEGQGLSAGGYEAVVVALNLARNRQIQNIKTLRLRMGEAMPGREKDIEEGLRYWANYEAEKRLRDQG